MLHGNTRIQIAKNETLEDRLKERTLELEQSNHPLKEKPNTLDDYEY